MNSTIEAHRSVHELEDDLEKARDELAAAEAAEQVASDAARRAKEDHAIGRILRGAWLATQKSLAARMEATELAKAKVRGRDRLLSEERERIADEKARTIAARQQRIRAEGAAISLRVGDLLGQFRDGLEALEQELAEHNTERVAAGVARLRPPSDWPVVHSHLTDSVARLMTVFPPPTKEV